jgi:hypothetical protein
VNEWNQPYIRQEPEQTGSTEVEPPPSLGTIISRPVEGKFKKMLNNACIALK